MSPACLSANALLARASRWSGCSARIWSQIAAASANRCSSRAFLVSCETLALAPVRAWPSAPFQPPLFPRARLRSHTVQARICSSGKCSAPCAHQAIAAWSSSLAPAKIDDHPPGIDALAIDLESRARPSAIACFGQLLLSPRDLTMQASYSPARLMGARRLWLSLAAVS